MTAPDEVERLRNHLVGAVQRALRLCNGFAVLHRGDLASGVLAAMAKELSDVPFVLLHVASSEGPRPLAARREAKQLGVDLIERYLVEAEISHLRQELARLTVDPTPESTFLIAAARETLLSGGRLIVPSGAPGALDRFGVPEQAVYERVAGAVPIQLRLPYLDKGVLPYLQRLRDGGNDPMTVFGSLSHRLGITRDELATDPG